MRKLFIALNSTMAVWCLICATIAHKDIALSLCFVFAAAGNVFICLLWLD